MHNKKERAQITSGLVKGYVALFTPTMHSKDTLDEYCTVFKEQVDKIKAHDGNLGYHHTFYCSRFKAYAEKEG